MARAVLSSARSFKVGVGCVSTSFSSNTAEAQPSLDSISGWCKMCVGTPVSRCATAAHVAVRSGLRTEIPKKLCGFLASSTIRLRSAWSAALVSVVFKHLHKCELRRNVRLV